MIKLKSDDDVYHIVNIYAPNNTSERKKFFASLEQWIKRHITENLSFVLTGDFNTAINKEDRKSGLIDPCSSQLVKIINGLRLLDIWKNKNPQNIMYTWESTSNSNIKSRIDYIFISKNLSPVAENSSIISAPVGDHRGVTLKLNSKKDLPGPNYWKLNVSVLQNKDYCEQIIKIFQQLTQECSSQGMRKTVIWDLFKVKVKEFSIRYGKEKAKAKKDELSKLEHDLEILDEAIHRTGNILLKC